MRRDNREEQRARLDLLFDRRVPDIAAAELALIEPDLDPCGAEARADPLCGVRVLGGVADKYGSLATLSGGSANRPLFVGHGVASGVLILKPRE
jgi:hypothetical protein